MGAPSISAPFFVRHFLGAPTVPCRSCQGRSQRCRWSCRTAISDRDTWLELRNRVSCSASRRTASRSYQNRAIARPRQSLKAMRFLTDEWLCDVACDYTSRCILIASAADHPGAAALPERPHSSSRRPTRQRQEHDRQHGAHLPRPASEPAAARGRQTRRNAVKPCLAYLWRGCPPSCGTISRAVEIISCPTHRKGR